MLQKAAILLISVLTGACAAETMHPGSDIMDPFAEELMITPAQWLKRGGFFKWNGPATANPADNEEQIFFVDEGSGPVVLFLHGYPTSSYDWRLIWEDLQPGNRLIALDFRGFGYSARPDDDLYSIHSQADLIQALLRHLDVREVRLVAHDYAVSVTQELLARQNEGNNPFQIQSVVFLNGAIFPDEHRRRFIQSLLLSPLGGLVNRMAGYDTFSRNMNAVLGTGKVPEVELKAQWYLINYPDNSRILHRLMHYVPDRETHFERWIGALRNTDVPIRLINGSMDPVSGKHIADRFREEMDEADVIELQDIGHYPQLESPKETARAILEWQKGGW